MSRAKELAKQILDALEEIARRAEAGGLGSPPQVAMEPADWPMIAQGLNMLPEPDNYAFLLHRAVLNTDDTMTCHIPILTDTRSAQAHVAAFRLMFRQFAAEFALKTQRSMDEIMMNLIHELHEERRMPIGEKPEYEGPLIELPPGVKPS